MTTMQDMVDDTRRNAFGSMPESLNIIHSSASAGATSLVMELDVTGILPGQLLSCGLNVWYVKSVDTSTKTIGVIPNREGSPSPAVSAGSVVYVSPQVTDWYLFNVVNDAIRSMSSPSMGLYKRGTWTASVDSTYQTYAIPTAAQSMVSLIGARWRSTSDDQWIEIPSRALDIQRSENLIRIRRQLPAAGEVEFRYKGPFTVAADLSSDAVSYCGLTDSMIDIPPLGACAAIFQSTEGRRNQVQVQGDPRRAEEVQQTGNLRMASSWASSFRDRCNQEYARLVAAEPIRRGI